jgi:fructokinase
MNRTTQIACVGELIVDYISTQNGVTLEQARSFARFAGGACANVAVGAARLGVPSAFYGKVGKDSLGRFLASALRRNRVDTRGLVFDPAFKTRLAFVSKTKSGERDFEFWERWPADERLRAKDVNMTRITAATIVHLSSFLLLRQPSRSTVFDVARAARKRGCEVSFDPNIRFSLWRSRAEARRILMQMARLCSILRLNEDEAKFLSGKSKVHASAEWLLERGPKLVAVTRGTHGAFLTTSAGMAMSPGLKVKAIDTTGCGDAFLAALLAQIVRASSRNKGRRVEQLSLKELGDICAFANAAGALTATREGGIPALPHLKAVQQFITKSGASQIEYHFHAKQTTP